MTIWCETPLPTNKTCWWARRTTIMTSDAQIVNVRIPEQTNLTIESIKIDQNDRKS